MLRNWESGGEFTMMTGAHMIIYSTQPEADRAFLQEHLKLPNVDAGEGWLIFGLPLAEVAVHPAERDGVHELYLMCADVEVLMEELRSAGIRCDPIVEARWGRLTYLTLPGGGKLGIYEPRHARPAAPSAP
jgi:hypothetical protein